jgi:hypothetical protein
VYAQRIPALPTAIFKLVIAQLVSLFFSFGVVEITSTPGSYRALRFVG